MPTVNENTLKKMITSGEVPGLYVIAGEEKYLVARLAKQLIKRAAGETFPEFNDQSFTDDSSLDSIADAAEALPFFAERKCVSVADFDVESKSASDLDKLYELWEVCPETTTLVFWYPTLDFDGKRSSKWKKFLSQAETRGTVTMCVRRTQGDLQRYLVQEAGRNGCTMERPAQRKLLEYTGPDMTALHSEMEKLCAYALGSGSTEVTPEMVEEMAAKSAETTAFLMAGALVAGRYDEAYRLLDLLFYQREDPISIAGALSSSYLDMVRVRAALENGGTFADAAQYGDYKKKQFVLERAQKNVKGVSQQVLRESIHLLVEADLALKSSRLDQRVVLDELIAKLLLAARGDRA